MKRLLSPARLVLLFLLVATPMILRGQGVLINEFMAANATTIADPDYHAFSDWVEIYNPSPDPVNLKGFSITDLLAQPGKYRFASDLVIPPFSCVVVWCDDRAVQNHTNFKLSASGESIGLFDPTGNVVDTLTFGPQETDISMGRVPDGSLSWYRLFPASPGSANTAGQIYDKLLPPLLSIGSGFYTGSQQVTITHPVAGVQLRYTIDGQAPSAASPLYTSPIRIDTTTPLRVRSFKSGSLPSPIVTATFLIDEPTTLPVVSLVTDPANFFSDTAGIYVIGTNGIIGHCSTAPRNWNQDWERPVVLELFEKDRHSAFQSPAGVKIFGGCARLYPEKSLAFYFRDVYGAGKLSYRLFDDLCLTEYNNFLLRSSGQDWWRTMFRDGMVQTLARQGMHLDCQAYRPAILFINGAYWGIHNIREKLNEHYVHYHHGVHPDSLDLVEHDKGVAANNGDLVAYNAMVDYLGSHDLSDQANYDYIASVVDIDEYIDYHILEIYAANGDWPGSNMKLWRERSPTARWRWMLSDLDFTFGGNAQGQYNTNTLAQATATNGPSWPNPPWSTLMLRKLLGNPGFRNEFIQRYAVHFNTTFDPDRVIGVIDSLQQQIAPEIPRHKLRWPQSLSIGTTWPENVQIMRDFASSRRSATVGHFTSYFGLEGAFLLTVQRNDPARGRVLLHDIEVRNYGSAHPLFKGIPLRIKAMAMPGSRFVRWEGVITSTAPETTLVLNGNGMLTAVFEEAPLMVTTPVINEINYQSAPLFDTGDWVEFYNPSADPVDLSGWTFSGEGATVYTFPAGSSITGGGYLVLCRDTSAFGALRPEVACARGNTGFGLSSAGERLRLIDGSGRIVDEVAFEPGGSWPAAANGTGATLALIDPQKENSLPEYWRASQGYGTPGGINDVYTHAEERDVQLPAGVILLNNYPNPFNPSTRIRFGLPAAGAVSLEVINTLGQVVALLANGPRTAGYHEVVFDARGLSSGVYFCRLQAGNRVFTTKLLLVR